MKIISIMSDEHSGSAIFSSGDKYAVTPALDKLAEKGITFSECYSPCPVCVPARASWFTGQFVCRLGTWDNSTPYDGKVLGIAEHLGKFNIPVYHIGKTHFHHEGEYHFAGSDNLGLLKVPDVGCYYRDDNIVRIGADKRFLDISISDGSERFDDKVLNSTLSWLNEHGRDDQWILNVGFIEPHFPFHVRQDNWDYFETLFKDIPLPKEVIPPYTSLNSSLKSLRHYFNGEMATDDIIRKVRIGYYAAIKELDEKIQAILDKISELGIEDEIAIIYTSDHGEQLGYHGLWWKCCMFEQSARIPMIVSLPRGIKHIDSTPISLTDLFPTLCDAFEVPSPKNIDGQSFWNIVNGKGNADRRDFAFSEFNAHGLPGGMYMIRWEKYKYIFYTDDPPQLFNMEEDPFENHDLVREQGDSPLIKEVLHECNDRLLSICNPFEVTARSKRFQSIMKKKLGLPNKYTIARGGNFVPHPDYSGVKNE